LAFIRLSSPRHAIDVVAIASTLCAMPFSALDSASAAAAALALAAISSDTIVSTTSAIVRDLLSLR